MSILTVLSRSMFLSALLCATAVQAADPAAATSAQTRFKQDMAVCNSGQSNQGTATCKIEAERARAEARRGGLTAASASDYARNALRRCAVFQGDARTACEARMQNPSSLQGSVQSGGILRESVTLVPVPNP